MNHFSISMIKSCLRIFSSILGFGLLWVNVFASIMVLAAGYGIAEILGILEEIFDKRKEE